MTDFDTLFDALLPRTIGLDKLTQFSRPTASFPPYNIRRIGDEITEIQVAVAGYGPDDLRIFERNGVLHIESDGGKTTSDDDLIYKGIAKRSFKLTFALGANVVVDGASCNNGMAVVRLSRSVAEDHLIPISNELPAIEGPDDVDKEVRKISNT